MSEVTGRGNPTGVVVITGTGGMGRAIAHRLAPGRHVVLADRDEGALADVSAALTAIGHVVTTQPSTCPTVTRSPSWPASPPTSARSSPWSTPPACHRSTRRRRP